MKKQPIIFLPALLRYNPHTMQFTPRKSTVQSLVYSQSCTNIATISFKNIFIAPPKPHSLIVTPMSHPALPSTTYLIFISTDSMDLPIVDFSDRQNHIICCLLCLASFAYIFSRFIQVVARISTLFTFIDE